MAGPVTPPFSNPARVRTSSLAAGSEPAWHLTQRSSNKGSTCFSNSAEASCPSAAHSEAGAIKQKVVRNSRSASQADQKRNLNPSWMARPVLFSSVIVPNAELLGVVFGLTNIT